MLSPRQQLRRLSDAAWHIDLRRRIVDRRFSVVSNNCWGSAIYPAVQSEYQTPFVGLFLMPDCYLALLADLRKRLASKLTFQNETRYPAVNMMRERHNARWPIGSLGEGVEIHFMHYVSREEAIAKWERRLARLAPEDESVAVKLCDRDGLSESQCRRFAELPFRKKVLFTSTVGRDVSCAVSLSTPTPDGAALMSACRSRFDVASWLNGYGTIASSAYLTRARLFGWK